MIIRTRNVPKEIIPTVELKEAAEFFIDSLLTKRQSKNLSLNIVFEDMDIKGYCEWLDKPVKPKEFKIAISKKYKQKTILLTLAHEIVHLKQYTLGELTDQTTKSNVKWKKELINEDSIDYYYLPYEIEAYGLEFGLFYNLRMARLEASKRVTS